MPYEIRGKKVVKKKTGKVVGHSKNPKKYLRTLRAIEHGWHPTKSVRISDHKTVMGLGKKKKK